MPIHVGKAISKLDLGIPGDDTGDNISVKNPGYCELTGMYWAWKNLKGVDIIGLCHYRRYFDFHRQCNGLRAFTIVPSCMLDSLDLSVPDDVIKAVSQGSVVTANPMNFPYNLRVDYCNNHVSDDFRTLEAYINETQPEKIKTAFYRKMYLSNSLYPCNMFLMTFDMFDRYCTWIFKVLADLEKRINIINYSQAQARIWGFMAERLFNVWLEAEKADIISRPILHINDNDANESLPSYLLHNTLRQISFACSASWRKKLRHMKR